MKKEKKYLIDESDSMQLEDGSLKYDANRDFTSLNAWAKARLVKLFFYNKVIPILPTEEKYCLDIQIRKASISSTANIAEGYGRYYFKDAVKFYRISRASVYELKDHIISCFDLKYIDENIYEEGIALIEDAKVTINGYMNYIKNKIKE